MIRRLGRNDHLRLRGARGTSLRVVEGRVWITEPDCGQDRFVAAGGCYSVRGDGLVLVSSENEPTALVDVASVA
jgi:hypothetical protein